MATQVLGIAGAIGGYYLGGPIGAKIGYTVGSSIGSYLDFHYINPPKFPEAQRLHELQFMGASEGEPVPNIFGKFRVGGNLIWMSEARKLEIEQPVGKGMKQTSYVSGYEYYCDLAIAVCEGEIQNIEKIIADGNMLYDEGRDGATIVSDEITITEAEHFYIENPDYEITDPDRHRRYLILEAQEVGPDLSVFFSGAVTQISGSSERRNNGKWICVRAEKDLDYAKLKSIEDDIHNQLSNVKFEGIYASKLDANYRLHFTVRIDGSDYIIEVFRDSARTDLVAEGVATSATETDIEIKEANDSGISAIVNLDYNSDSASIYAQFRDIYSRAVIVHERDEHTFEITELPAIGTRVYLMFSRQAYRLHGASTETIGEYQVQAGDTISDVCDGLVEAWNTGKINKSVVERYTAEHYPAGSVMIIAPSSFEDELSMLNAKHNFNVEMEVAPIAQDAGELLTITQDLPENVFTHSDGRFFKSMRIYRGTNTQDPDETIDAIEGGFAPAFKGIAYVVFEDFALTPFGNRPPQFNFIVNKGSETVSGLVTKLCLRAGLESSQIDVSKLPTEFMHGYAITQPQPVASALADILFAYDIATYEQEGKVVFLERKFLEESEIDVKDFVELPKIDENNKLDLPSRVTVDFPEPANDYQTASQLAERPQPWQHHEKMGLPVVVSADTAKALAQKALWQIETTRKLIRLELPPSYNYLNAGDVMIIEGERFFAAVVSIGVNGVVEIQGTSYSAFVFDQTAEADPPRIRETESFLPPSAYGDILDCGVLRQGHENVGGVYVSRYLEDIRATNPGIFVGAFTVPWIRLPWDIVKWTSHHEAVLAESAGGMVSLRDGQMDGVVGGIALSELPPPDFEEWDGIWDYENEVIVKIFSREGLISADLEFVLNGTNWAFLGGEIIAWQKAELITANTYRLSRLMRGVRNTEFYMNKHSVQESFMHFNPNALGFLPLSLSNINNKMWWFFVTHDRNISRRKPKIFQANNLKCWSPCHVKASRDTDNNLTVSWIRRDRTLFRHFSGSQSPSTDTPERYEIDICDENDEVVRTFFVEPRNPGGGDYDVGKKSYQFPQIVPEYSGVMIYDGGEVSEEMDIEIGIDVPNNRFTTADPAGFGGIQTGDTISVKNIATTGLNDGVFKVIDHELALHSTWIKVDKPLVNDAIALHNVKKWATGIDQINDGLIPGDPIKMKLYQTNRLVGRGRPKVVEV